MKITGNEPITPQHPAPNGQSYNQKDLEYIEGNSLLIGLTLKQHMVIEFTKSSGFEQLPNHIQATICEEDAPFMELPDLDGGTERYSTYGEPYVQWLVTGKVKYAILLANEVIKQLNDEDKQ